MKFTIILMLLVGGIYELTKWYRDGKHYDTWVKAGKPCLYKDWDDYLKTHGCRWAGVGQCYECPMRDECSLNKKMQAREAQGGAGRLDGDEES